MYHQWRSSAQAIRSYSPGFMGLDSLQRGGPGDVAGGSLIHS